MLHSYPDYVILKAKKYKGSWHDLFENDHPIHVEIGCGKGKFIYESALENPDINFIGIEKYDSVIVRALEKLIVQPLDNVKLVRLDATHIEDVFKEGEIDKLYLNFSDPWPKKRHAKRRLTSPRFLKRYQNVLKNEALIELKTDNYGLFEYSMMMFNNHSQYHIESLSLDLYKHVPKTNIQTEFELKFIEENKAIYFIKIYYQRSGE